MKIMVLGSTGMLGHRIVKQLEQRHDVWAYGARVSHPANLLSLEHAVADGVPEVIVNCAGIVKQRESTPEEMIRTNALLPHELFRAARNVGARLIHFSTDCVFSGRYGAYTEDHPPDPEDLYGRTKLLGEVNEEGCLTIRTSIIGRELTRKLGLVEWFLSQTGPVKGYPLAYFSGLTTLELARVVERCITHNPNLSGIWHVGGDRISKCSLLEKLEIAYIRPTQIVPDASVRIDRSLDSTRFRLRTGWTPPSWDDMIAELAKECPL